MGFTPRSEVCGNEKDFPSINNEFLLIAQQKAMLLRKTFAKPEEKNFLNDYVSEDKLNILLPLISLE
jgi:hypothetical protein